MINFFCVLLCLLAVFNEFVNSQADTNIVYKANPIPRQQENRIRIITQSCNYQYYKPNNLWLYMVALEPDVITLLGDTVYLDGEPCNSDTQNCKSMFDLACDVLDCDKEADISCFNYCWASTTWYEDPAKQYNYLLNDTQFSLNKRYNKNTWPVPVFPIWDDHDYCRDNSNKSCNYKNLTRDAFVEFVGSIDQANVLNNVVDYLTENTHVGIFYHTDYNKTFSDNSTLRLRFYMMDVRWYRTEKDMFGEEQRLWFENLLLENDISDIHYHIICIGSTRYPTFGIAESLSEPWPTASKDWFENVTSIAGVRNHLILLSGDVHYSAIYKDNKTFEIVTSAMTHGIYDAQVQFLESVQKDDDYLITDIVAVENIGVLEIGFDGFDLIYINQSGLPIVNFSYNYATDTHTYNIIQKDFQDQDNSDFWNSRRTWIVAGVAIGVFVLCVIGICYWCYRRRKSAPH